MKHSSFEIVNNSEKLTIHLINGDKLIFVKHKDEYWISIREEDDWVNVMGYNIPGEELDLSIPKSSILYIQYH